MAFRRRHSHGFLEGFPMSRHTISCAVIAAEDGRGCSATTGTYRSVPRRTCRARSRRRLRREACLARLGSRKIGTVQAPVLFEAPVANDLLATFGLGGERGKPLPQGLVSARQPGQGSLRADRHAVERPHCRARRRAPGTTTKASRRATATWSRTGCCRGYFLGSYSARKLGLKTTGSAGGNHNLILQGGDLDLPASSGRWVAGFW